jgi:hypothetical protein
MERGNRRVGRVETVKRQTERVRGQGGLEREGGREGGTETRHELGCARSFPYKGRGDDAPVAFTLVCTSWFSA